MLEQPAVERRVNFKPSIMKKTENKIKDEHIGVERYAHMLNYVVYSIIGL